MNKIGFKNFRRFKELDPLEYKGITFLVGRNNSGKSTMVKALLLVNEYLNSDRIKTFSFGNNVLEDANIVTFGRAINNHSSDDRIIFMYQIDEYFIEISVTGDNDSTDGIVSSLLIIDSTRNIRFAFDFIRMLLTVSKTKKDAGSFPSSTSAVIAELNKEINALEKIFELAKFKKSSKMYINFIDELNNLKERRNKAAHFIDDEDDSKPFVVKADIESNKDFAGILESYITQILALHDIDFRKAQNNEKPSKEFPNYRGFKFELPLIEESFNTLISKLNSQSIIYLGANPSKQSALFAIRDKNNALAQAVHNFAPSDQLEFDEASEWAVSWMKKFSIGDAFSIKLHAGESYEVKILTEGGEVQLADMGMGSIQTLLLIFRLASIIRRTKNSERKTLVVIEEPELNLHPALQRQLAYLFLEVHEKYNISFIIETHSEYLIRETQQIVKVKEFEIKPNENPFCVIYFDFTQRWNMTYREDGVFIQDFGTGFFDVASQQAVKLFQQK